MPRIRHAHLPARVFENIDNDNTCSEAIRDDAINAMSGCANVAEARARFEAWCAACVAAGRLPVHNVAFLAVERIGRLRYRDNYASAVADILRSDALLGGVDESDIEELLKWVFGEPTSIDDAVANYLFDLLLADRPIESTVGWYFRGEKRDAAPFAGNTSCLPWRLGLPYVRSGSRYIGFSVDARGLVNPRLPVFMDVKWDFHEFWRPNGKTEPHPGLPGGCVKTGLDELLAGPPAFRNVVRPTERIVAE